MKHVAVIGASGAIGSAFVRHLISRDDVAKIYTFSRSEALFESDKVVTGHLDAEDEASISEAAAMVDAEIGLDMVLVAIGVLHGDHGNPEKALKELDAEKFHIVMAANMIGPALIAKHFLPLLPRDRRSVFAALSARVGSISDNHLGGWYAYRAAKAALNMFLKTASIEVARKYPEAVVIGLHPGTVDSALSKPFQGHVKPGKLFSPELATERMLVVVDEVEQLHTGCLIAYDGQKIPF